MNYDSDRAMNPKRLQGEAAHGVVQGNGLPLNYMDNGHQIPYQPYAGAYNTHYPPPDAFSAYGPPPPGGYAPQNLSYAPPAHQNYPHHQSFPQQQAQLHMAQPHMVQGYAAGEVGVHKWPPQHLLPPHDPQKLDMKPKPEIKLEPPEGQKRTHPPEADIMGDIDQPKIKIKTDIFKPEEAVTRPEPEQAIQDNTLKAVEVQPPVETRKDEVKPDVRAAEEKSGEKPPEVCKAEALVEEAGGDTPHVTESITNDPAIKEKFPPDGEGKIPNDVYFGTPDSATYKAKIAAVTSPSKTPSITGLEPKKRGRPKGSTNKPKTPPATGATPNRVLTPNTPNAPAPLRVGAPTTPATPNRPGIGRPRGGAGYQYAIRPFRKDFSGIQFRRRWSDDCLDSSHIPNEVFFGDVPVSTEVLFNYYDAGVEREKIAAQAAQIAAQKAAAAKLAAAKLAARGLLSNEVTTVDSSSSDSSSGSDSSDSSDSDDDAPLKRGRPKGSKSGTPRRSSSSSTPGRRGRPPIPPELREPGITEMKKFCKAAGLRFDYKKLVEGCTKNKERVNKMLDLLTGAGLEGKPTLEKCKAIKQAKQDQKDEEKKKKQQAKVKVKAEPTPDSNVPRRMTRGQTGTKPRQKIVISSEEEDDTPDARRTLSKLRSMVDEESGSD